MTDKISIHAPREGSDRRAAGPCLDTIISIHAPREGSDQARNTQSPKRPISIHAPREGSDNERSRRAIESLLISIHAPREGSDALPIVQTLFGNKFLSTLPARGAT